MGSTCSSSETPAVVEQVKTEQVANTKTEQVADTPVEESTLKQEGPPAPKLTIMIMGARLPGMGASDTFAKVKIAGKDDDSCSFHTKTINDTLTPFWREETSIFEFNGDEDLEFSVWDGDVGKSPDALGKVVMKNAAFATKGFNGELLLEGAGKSIDAFLRVKVKMDGMGDYPEGPAAEFTIKFDKDPKAKTLGLDVDETDGRHIYVINVKDGPFKAYNETADVDKQLRSGDFLIKVNDKEGSSQDMLKELKGKASFEIVARRPEEFTVAINKKAAKSPLGLAFPTKLMGNALPILTINDGPFKEWNEANEAHKVQEKDRVVSVAGCRGKAADLRKKMLSLSSYLAIIARPAEQSSSCSWY